jgi:hypothetical protein
MPPHLIVLDVSGRRYTTREITLRASPYFRNLLARWDDCDDKQEDCSYFVDADADAFQYVLDFMRRPSKFPLFWTKETGFDYALYIRLEAEADYFLLHDLRDWIRKKRYLDAVRTVVGTKILSGAKVKDPQNLRNYEANVDIRSFLDSYTGERSYRNPCVRHDDRGEPVRGCRLCEELLHTHGPQYNSPSKELTLVITKIVFDETVCVNETVA